MTTNASINYDLMQNTQPLEVKSYTPPYVPRESDKMDLGTYLTAAPEEALWQGLSAEHLHDFLQNMSYSQALRLFQQATPQQAAAAFSQLSPKKLSELVRPPASLSKEDLALAVAALTPEQQHTAHRIAEQLGSMIQAQAVGNPRVSAAHAMEISSLANDLALDATPPSNTPTYKASGLGSILGAFADWIASINQLMGELAIAATQFAELTATLSVEETQDLAKQDDWHDDWAGDPVSAHSGTGPHGEWNPGPDTIPQEGVKIVDSEGDDVDVTDYYYQTWETSYQIKATTWNSELTLTNSQAQSYSDAVNNMGTGIQDAYTQVRSINDLMDLITQLTSR